MANPTCSLVYLKIMLSLLTLGRITELISKISWSGLLLLNINQRVPSLGRETVLLLKDEVKPIEDGFPAPEFDEMQISAFNYVYG